MYFSIVSHFYLTILFIALYLCLTYINKHSKHTIPINSQVFNYLSKKSDTLVIDTRNITHYLRYQVEQSVYCPINSLASLLGNNKYSHIKNIIIVFDSVIELNNADLPSKIPNRFMIFSLNMLDYKINNKVTTRQLFLPCESKKPFSMVRLR